MTLISGTKLRLFDGDVAIARATDCSVDFTAETESTSDKDSVGGWVEIEVGDLSGTASSNFLIEEVAGGWSTLFAKFKAKTGITAKFTDGVVGNSVISGTAYITAMNKTGTHKQKATGSVSLTFSGEVTDGTVTS